MKKDKSLSEDESDKLKSEIDKLTKTYVGKIEGLLEKKTTELMEV